MFVVSPVISRSAGILRYSRGTSSPISDDTSWDTPSQSNDARTSDINLRNQLCAIQDLGDFTANRPNDARLVRQLLAPLLSKPFARMHHATGHVTCRDRDNAPSRRVARKKSRPFLPKR